MNPTHARLPKATAFLWIACLLAAANGCAPDPQIRIPPPDNTKTYGELEEQLGRQMEFVFAYLYRVDDDPALVNRLRHVARQLAPFTERSQIAYSFHILDTKKRNAISLTNGRILVTRGLFELVDDDAMLASVVGHEMAHINLRHSLQKLERVQHTLWKRIFVNGTVGLIPVAGRKLSYMLVDEGYDQNQELEADRHGVDYLVAAGLDAEASARLVERMDQDPECQKDRGFLKTHPDGGTRAAAIREHIRAIREKGKTESTPTKAN